MSIMKESFENFKDLKIVAYYTLNYGSKAFFLIEKTMIIFFH